MALSTARWSTLAALALFALLAGWLLREGFRPDRVLISSDSLALSLPWSEHLEPEPSNRFLVDQSRIYYPYLLEAQRVYAGETDALWTSRGGGGLPFLGNMTSSLFHPVTLLVAFLPAILVPLVGGLVTLVASALFTFLFLRRLGLATAPCLMGALAFGFCGHQVLWLQYALAHTLIALPLCFWAVERLRADRGRRRIAVLAIAFALLIFGGHPETSWIAAIVAGLWALWRLWDAHGRWIVMGAVLLGVALSAVQWVPFLAYALDSHGMVERDLHTASRSGRWGAAIVYAGFFVMAFSLLRSSTGRSFTKRVLAIGALVVVVVMARRMGMAVSGGVMVLPNLYGSPVDGGSFDGAQDYPGLAAGYAGVLPALLLVLGLATGLGGGFVRFFGIIALLLWGAAFHMPAAETFVRAVPGLGALGSTRLLGPVAFLTACGGAKVLDVLCAAAIKPGFRAATVRIGLTLLAGLALSAAVLRIPTDPHGGRTVVSDLAEPKPGAVVRGDVPMPIKVHLTDPVDDLRITVNGRVIRSGPAIPPETGPFVAQFLAQRSEEGSHRLRVESWRAGRRRLLADQGFVIARDHMLHPRDLVALAASLVALGVILSGRRRAGAALAVAVVALDMLSFGDGYNTASSVDDVFPQTATTTYLAAQPGPFRIFTEGTVMPPDTQFAVGVDHLLSYDNLGFHRNYLWLLSVLDMDAFASFSFSRANVEYDNPRFDALDVRYVITDRGTDLSAAPDMQLVHESETRIWENTGNLGRAFIVGDVAVLDPDRATQLGALDPADVALLEAPLDVELGGSGSARVVEHTGASVRVLTETDGPALLVLTENRSEGWQASIDGTDPIPTLPCNVTWQAVVVPAGQHEVLFAYEPLAFRWGLRFSLAAGALLLLMLLLPRHVG